MGMPRKGSRKVEVEGETFFWRTRPEGRPNHLLLTCQRDEERPGRVLQVVLRSTRVLAPSQLTPEDVREAIGYALKKGWDPSERGAAFTPKGRVQLPEYESAH